MYQVYHSSRKMHIFNTSYMRYIHVSFNPKKKKIYIRLSVYIEKIYIVSGCIQLPEIELLRLQRGVVEKHTG